MCFDVGIPDLERPGEQKHVCPFFVYTALLFCAHNHALRKTSKDAVHCSELWACGEARAVLSTATPVRGCTFEATLCKIDAVCCYG